MPLKTTNSKFQIPKFKLTIATFFLMLLLWQLSHGMALLPEPEKQEASACDFQRVLRVIDGDTFELSDGARVRLIGVDTPETVDPREDVQWFGREASRKLKEWINGETVCLRQDRDKTQDIDKYGRLLRYIWKSEGFFVNAEIIRQGYGFAYTRYPFEYLEEFRKYERDARGNNSGLWDIKKQDEWGREVEKNKALAKTCGEKKTICPADAMHHMGQRKTVRFFVKKSYDSGKAVFLNSKNNFEDHDNFTAVMFESDRNNFPTDPADFYWGKTIDVSGKIEEYKGRAEIILKDSSQIQHVR